MAREVINDAAAALKARRSELEAEIAERESELKQVRAAEAALAPVLRNGAGKSRPSSKRGRRSRNGKKVDRAAEFKLLVSKQPTITPTEAARAMGISSQQVHGVIKRLRDRGELTRGKNGAFKVA